MNSESNFFKRVLRNLGVNLNYSIDSWSQSNRNIQIKAATLNNVIYPSLDPSIFELKFPQTDIKGRVVTF